MRKSNNNVIAKSSRSKDPAAFVGLQEVVFYTICYSLKKDRE
jgi:hypothetical protein